jgi:hypothetical protein
MIRDPLLTTEFLSTLDDAGVKSVLRRTICADDQGTVAGEDDPVWRSVVAKTLHNFVAHYHTERNHRGLANRISNPEPAILEKTGPVKRRPRLGGMLNYLFTVRPDACQSFSAQPSRFTRRLITGSQRTSVLC